MKVEERLELYKQQTAIEINETKILDTIQKSKAVFYEKEQERLLTYMEFLWTQFGQLKKRWWLFQILLLITAGFWLPSIQKVYGEIYMQRSMGVISVLFVVFAIPELWKNMTCNSMEIEAASYYSLKQIYAARMLLFGVTDVLLLTIFCGIMKKNMCFTCMELLVQFLFPMVVTACICFGMLCNKYSAGEAVSIALCFIWSGVWWLLLLKEEIYGAIVLPVWLCLFGIAVLFFAFVVYRTLCNCNEYWEENISGIKNN